MTFFISQMTLHDHLVKGTCELVIGSPSNKVVTQPKTCFYIFCGNRVTTTLFCNVA